MKLKVATRGSALALWQTEWVIRRLRELHGAGLEVEVLTLRTRGDQVQDVPIAQIGGKGIFVKEIEQAILSCEADFGVHSLKDMPAEQPQGLAVVAVPEREDARDALVLGVRRPAFGAREERDDPPSEPMPHRRIPHLEPQTSSASCLNALPLGASVGTSSRRRGAALLHERPDLRVSMLRGNLDTRLRKLEMGEHDAAVLAAAGLRRLGFEEQIAQLLPVEHFVPCAGQGALGVEARVDDERTRALLEPLGHPATATAVAAERVVLRRLGASCDMPLGVHAMLEGGVLRLYAMLASLDGADLVRVATSAPANDPEQAGHRLADTLIEAGGEQILAGLGQGDG